MEVKLGYKQTEVGVIPEDWEIKSLDSIAFVTSGKRLPLGKTLTKHETSHPYIRVSDMRPGTVVLDEIMFVPEEVFPAIRRYRIFREDIFISVAGTLGIVGVVPVELNGANLTENADRITNITCSQKYLLHVLMSPYIQNTIDSLQTVGAQPKLALTRIRKFDITLPPTLKEQESIAEALSDADALIESLEQLIAKKRHIKQGAMQELLRPKDGWVNNILESIADVIDPHPSHRAPKEVPNGIPFVGIGDLGENGDIIGTKLRTVDPSVFEEHLSRYDLHDELIGLGRVASIGKVVKLKFDGNKYVISPTLGIIRGTKVRRDYLLCALKSQVITDQFIRIMSGSTRSSVGMNVLRRLTVPHPIDPKEQAEIACVLSDMDTEIAELKAKLTKILQIKQGMMQELLTGRIRLV